MRETCERKCERSRASWIASYGSVEATAGQIAQVEQVLELLMDARGGPYRHTEADVDLLSAASAVVPYKRPRESDDERADQSGSEAGKSHLALVPWEEKVCAGDVDEDGFPTVFSSLSIKMGLKLDASIRKKDSDAPLQRCSSFFSVQRAGKLGKRDVAAKPKSVDSKHQIVPKVSAPSIREGSDSLDLDDGDSLTLAAALTCKPMSSARYHQHDVFKRKMQKKTEDEQPTTPTRAVVKAKASSSKKKPAGKPKELVMTTKCIISRAYHAEYRRCRDLGMDDEASKVEARKKYREAKEELETREATS